MVVREKKSTWKKLTWDNYYKDYYYANKEVIKVAQQKYYDKSQEKILLSRAKKRAKKCGWEFNLTVDDIDIPSHCPVLGIPLEVFHGKSGGAYGSPSLDRVDSSKGYTKDNTVVVSWRANHVKNNSSIEEMEAVVKFYKNYLLEDTTDGNLSKDEAAASPA